MSFRSVLILLSGWTFLFAAVPPSYSENEATIGAILPLTGDSAFWGENPKKGVELALGDLKAQDNITNLRFVFEDDHCNAKDAVAAFHKLVDVDKVKIILGPSCSSAAAAIAPLAERSKVLLLAFAESADLKTGPNVMRLWVPNSIQGRRLAEYAVKQNYRSVAAISVQNAFGTAITEAFAEKLTALGGRIVARQEFSPTAESLQTELLRLKSAKPDALFFASYIKDGAMLVQQARQMGFSVPLLGPSTINSPDFLTPTKNAADGLVFVDLADSTTPTFREKWSARYGAPFPGMQSGASLFYDISSLLGRWLQKNDAANAGEFLRSVDHSGAAGRIKFTSDGNLDRQHSLFTIKEGTVKPVPD